ncbi:MAG: alkaline phosphatase family protein [Bacteroidetes bacterium]|nr:MAG: alkaline phosphatase family protein [Bacteroidota bacterium]
MRKIFCAFVVLYMACTPLLVAQNEKPKLVVGVIVDQMRYDYLTRFYDKFGEGGFKRLMNKGFQCHNAHYNYIPTETAPGHASVFTGSSPAYHGIVANTWWENHQYAYCVGDTTERTVGAETSAGEMSPRNLLVTTFSDQVRIATNQRGRAFGVSIKDRGAILPVGHSANGAFWYDKQGGKFITSTYYMKKLPAWLQQYNDLKRSDKLIEEGWKTLLPIDQYTEAGPDDNNFESHFPTKEKSVFPYNLQQIRDNIKKLQLKPSIYDILVATPAGNVLVKEVAMRLLKEEKLGKGNLTDVLTISFSSTDLVGHYFGPQSVEVEDVYLRLDRELAEVLQTLDQEVGEQNYLFFLTSDHAGGDVPRYLQSMKIPGGYFDEKVMRVTLEKYLTSLYGEGKWFELVEANGLYLNKPAIEAKKLNINEVQDVVANQIRLMTGVYDAMPAHTIHDQTHATGFWGMIQRGYYHKRSPDVFVILKSGWLDKAWDERGGTSHGTPFKYDTHVPLLWYGWRVPQGKSTVRRVEIVDIAPSVCAFLRIQFPSGAYGEPIKELFE